MKMEEEKAKLAVLSGIAMHALLSNDCNNRLDRADIVSLSVNIAKEMLEEIDKAVKGGRND
jgi:hypothetical protein